MWLGLYVSLGPHRICILPRPGCADILPARSRVSDEDPRRDELVPGAASVDGEDVRASMGRRGVRMERVRDCDGDEIL